MADYEISSEELKKRISELIAERLREEEELANIQSFIENLPPEDADLMIKRGSSSRSNRDDRLTTRTREQVIAEAEANRARKTENIGLLLLQINKLQEQERQQRSKA